MENMLIYVTMMAVCPIHSTGYSTANTKPPLHLTARRSNIPSKIIDGSDSNSIFDYDTVNTNFDIVHQSGDDDDSGIRNVMKKRSAGKILIHLLPGLVEKFGGTIGNLLGLTKTEVQNQGITTEQLAILLEAFKESKTSGARRSEQTSTIMSWILTFITLRQYFGLVF